MSTHLFDSINRRVALDKENSDSAYFFALSLKLEYITKIVTSGVLACVYDDVDRCRYSLEHKLVRADSIGDWASTLNLVLTGPAVHLFYQQASNVRRDLSERVGSGDWQYDATIALNDAAGEVGAQVQLGPKVALRQFFEVGAKLRNRSRAHGAPTSIQCANACPKLFEAIDSVVKNLDLFKLPWVYLHRNISGKYRVSSLLGDASQFDYLKTMKDENLSNGVYIYLGCPISVPLISTDPEVSDIALPNGNYRNGSFDELSYATNRVGRRDASAWIIPPGHLPPSETAGGHELDVIGNVFTNVPPHPGPHIPRKDLEGDLRRELSNVSTHPIVSLTGPGGIGKTTIAIVAIHSISSRGTCPYDVILWISARDVDLLESGPKSVSPRVITQKDISRAAVDLLKDLLNITEADDKSFDPLEFFQLCLRRGADGSTLFVIDNFETVQNPRDVYQWIDTHIRLPNKVLITTRVRDFTADYPIEIGGMTDEQANDLIDQHARRLGVFELMTTSYRTKLIRETEGHPYVIKILLGEVDREQRAVNPERIVASSDHILKALFDRTYAALSPGGRRVFLLLSSWTVSVPEVAIEAILLRPGTERFNVAGAIEELNRFSLVDRIDSDEQGLSLVYVPLTAAIYGRAKLEVSPFVVSVKEDRRQLMELGPGRGRRAGQSVLPRIENLIRTVTKQVQSNVSVYEERRPVLEYLAARVPRAYLQLAYLALEVGPIEYERAKEYVRQFLEGAQPSERLEGWVQLGKICRLTQDPLGEVHAITEAAVSANDLAKLGDFANWLNQRIRQLKDDDLLGGKSLEVRGFLDRVIKAMEDRISAMVGTDCSRLAWLYLNVGNQERARDVVRIGLEREPGNEHCLNLMIRLDR